MPGREKPGKIGDCHELRPSVNVAPGPDNDYQLTFNTEKLRTLFVLPAELRPGCALHPGPSRGCSPSPGGLAVNFQVKMLKDSEGKFI
jgi:hypothetical protein